MKTFKSIIAVLAFMAMLPMQLFAQNAEEIMRNLNSNDKTLVAEAEQKIVEMADNAAWTCDSQTHDMLFNAIVPFVGKFPNCKSDSLLIAQLPKFCNERDALEIMQLIDNEKYADQVIRTVGDIKGTSDYIAKYILKHSDNLQHKAALAYAVGKQHITSMENELISWLDDADDFTKIEIYKALVEIKTNEKTANIVEKGAKKLYKNSNPDYAIAGLQIMTAVKGEKAMPMLYKALKNKDGKIRKAAFELMKPYANQGVVKKAMKKCKKGDALVDFICWLGDIKDDSQMEFLIKQLSSDNDKVVEATIVSIFKIDNADGINAVKPMFGGKYQEVIKNSMVTYEGDYIAVMNDVARGNDYQKLAVLQIVESRPHLAMFNRVNEMLRSDNQIVKNEAYNALQYVVTISTGNQLEVMLETCEDQYVEQVQQAIKVAMKDAREDVKDNFASTLKHVRPEIMPRFYKVFAYFGTELCVDKLIEAYQTGDYKDEAKDALLLIDNEQFKDKIEEALK